MQISKKGNLRDKTLLFQGRGVICFPEYLKPLFWLYKSNIEVLMISTVDPNGNLPYLANSYKSLCCLEWNGKGGGNLKLFEEDISSKLITDNFPNMTRFSLKPNFIRRTIDTIIVWIVRTIHTINQCPYTWRVWVNYYFTVSQKWIAEFN